MSCKFFATLCLKLSSCWPDCANAHSQGTAHTLHCRPLGASHSTLLHVLSSRLFTARMPAGKGNRSFHTPFTENWAPFQATARVSGPLTAVIGPCVDSYSCGIAPVRPTGHWRRDALMGPKLGDPLDDPPDSLEGEAGSQLTVLGGATSLTNQVRRVVGTKVLMAPTCSDGSEFSNRCIQIP